MSAKTPEAIFHKSVAGLLTKRQQGHVMQAFRDATGPLENAARQFIVRVDAGEVRSVRSYAAFKKALGE